jgi:hypothetical protein
MKVTRDFYYDRSTGRECYRWDAVVEGETLSVKLDRSRQEMQFGGPPLDFLEREAQDLIMRTLREKLFGSRAL